MAAPKKPKGNKRKKGPVESFRQRLRILEKTRKKREQHSNNAREASEDVEEWRDLQKERIERKKKRAKSSKEKAKLDAQSIAVDVSANEQKESIEQTARERIQREEGRGKMALKPIRNGNKRAKKAPRIRRRNLVKNYQDPWRSYPGAKKKPKE